MNILVLETDLKTILGVVDAFESFIWTDRYSECGDFQIDLPASTEFVNLFQLDRFILFSESEHVMVIEKVVIKTDAADGDHMTVYGRSFESVLDRRIVWVQTILSGNLQRGVKKLLNENVIAPSSADRAIPNLLFADSSDTSITSLTLSAQFTGDSIYDAVSSICVAAGIGFKITFNQDTQQFTFALYNGVNRTVDQGLVSSVIFSPYFDNLIDSNYAASSEKYKNTALVLGEGEGVERSRVELTYGLTGLARRELYVDARDLSTRTQDGELTQEQYIQQLSQRGHEKLADCTVEFAFDGSVDNNSTFRPGADFDLGDIVTVQNEYGLYKNCRIVEMIHSINDHENLIYPSFEEV